MRGDGFGCKLGVRMPEVGSNEVGFRWRVDENGQCAPSHLMILERILLDPTHVSGPLRLSDGWLMD